MADCGLRIADWPKVKLAEVAEQCLGKMLDAKKNKGRLMPYLRNPNVRWFDVDTSDLQSMPFEDHEHERYGLKAGDIVICEGGEAGRAAIWDGRLPDLKFQKAVHRVRPGPRLHNRFFVHRLMADHKNGRLGDYLTGATIKHFTGQDLARYQFPLPPLAEQRRIAEVLDRAEALRAKRRAALAQLDSLTQSLFLDLHRNAVANSRTVQLADVAEATRGSFVNGPFGSDLLTSELQEEGVPVIYIRDIRDGEYTRVSKSFVTERKARDLAVCSVRSGDVLVAKVGDPPGIAAIYPEGEPVGVVTQDVIRIRVSRDTALPEFVVGYLNSSIGLWKVAGITIEAIRARFSLRDFKAMKVELPPIPLQREFARRVTAVEALKTAQRASPAELDALFATLQHRAFRGELEPTC